MSKNKLSLSKKLTFATTFLVVIAVIVSMTTTLFQGQQIANSTVDEKLGASQTVQKALTEQRAKQLTLISLLVSSDPAFIAYLAEAMAPSGFGDQVDMASIHDLLVERKQQFGFDLAITINSEGQQVARSDQAMTVAKDLSELPLLKRTMSNLTPQSGFIEDQGEVHQAAAIPLARGGHLIGYFITGLALNDQFANDIRAISGSDVLLTTTQEGQRTVKATTLNNGQKDDFITAYGLQKSASSEQQSIKAGNQQYAYQTSIIEQSDLSHPLELVSIVSEDLILKPFTDSRNVLFVLGVLIAILSLGLCYWIVKQALKPLDTISRSTAGVSKGDYEVSFPENVGPDLSLLSNSVTQIAFTVRAKKALSNHLIEVSQSYYDHSERQKKMLGDKFKAGQTLGKRFEIITPLGAGGMGYVFKAYDHELKEVVALKVLKQSIGEEHGIDKFKEEIRIARRITDKNVVRIHDFGQLGNHAFISMEYISGYTLKDILDYCKKMSPLAAKYAAIEACRGLIASHQAGIIHKDIKPANLIVTLDSHVKLMDYGIASINNLVASTQSQNKVEGTTAFLSPEQIQGKGADERSDIYGMGVLLMMIFVGQKPYVADSEEALMLKVLENDPRSVKDFWADAPDALDDIIKRCLAKDPKDRYQRVTALLLDIDQLKL